MVADGRASDGLNTEYLAHSLRSDKVNQYRDSLAQQCPSSPDFDFDQFLQGPYSSSPLSPSPTPPEYAHVEEASAAGDLATVKRILDDWDTYMAGFGRAFISAIKNGYLAVASCLLEHGLQVEGFHFRYALEQKSYPFMQLCLDHGYNINDPDYPFKPGVLAEHLDDEHLTRWLLDHGADPNTERICQGGKMGQTPVSVAMWKAPFSTIELLIERGGPETFRCGHLLWYAVHRQLPDRLEVMEYLLNRGAAADVRRLEFEDRPEAAEQADWVLGRETPLHTAARTGHLDAVKLLVAWGADPAIPDSKGRLPIDAAEKGKSMKAYAVDQCFAAGDQEGVIEYLTSMHKRTNSPSDASSTRLERL